MSLKKRGQLWWIDIRSPYSGQRVRQSTGTGDKTLATEYHDKIAAELWRQDKLGEKPKRQWTEAVTRWLKESSHKASLADDKSHLRWLDRYLRDKTLDRISRRRRAVDRWIRPLLDAGPHLDLSERNRRLAGVRQVMWMRACNSDRCAAAIGSVASSFGNVSSGPRAITSAPSVGRASTQVCDAHARRRSLRCRRLNEGRRSRHREIPGRCSA